MFYQGVGGVGVGAGVGGLKVPGGLYGMGGRGPGRIVSPGEIRPTQLSGDVQRQAKRRD